MPIGWELTPADFERVFGMKHTGITLAGSDNNRASIQRAANAAYGGLMALAEWASADPKTTGLATLYSEDAARKVDEALDGVSREGFEGRLREEVEARARAGRLRAGDEARVAEGALAFFDRFSRRKVRLSDGRFVYFAPSSRSAGREETADRTGAWVEYAIHAVTNDVAKGGVHSRAYNAAKVAAMDDIERVIKEEQCFSQLFAENPERDAIIFMGKDGKGHGLNVVTRLDEYGNIDADLTEVTVVIRNVKRGSPRPMSLAEAVENMVVHQGTGYSRSTIDTIAQSGGDVKPSWSVDDAGGAPWAETAEGREMVRAAFHVLMKNMPMLLISPAEVATGYVDSPRNANQRLGKGNRSSRKEGETDSPGGVSPITNPPDFGVGPLRVLP